MRIVQVARSMRPGPHRALLTDRRGAGMVEYLIALGLVALLCVCAWRGFGARAEKLAEVEGERIRTMTGAPAQFGVTAPGTPKQIKPATVEAGEIVLAKAPPPKPAPPSEATFCKGEGCTRDFCFVAGTPVVTSRGLVAIETIAAGELVLSRDERTGETALRPVVRTSTRTVREVLDVEIAGAAGAAERIRATPEHPFWVQGRGWVVAGDLSPGDVAVGPDGEPLAIAAVATALDGADGVAVFNLEVDAFHTYFVGSTGVWVHNECKAADKVAENVARLEREAKAGSPDARWALGQVLFDGIRFGERPPSIQATQGLDDKERRDAKLAALKALVAAEAHADVPTYTAVAYVMGEAKKNGDKEIFDIASAMLERGRASKSTAALLALRQSATHPDFPGKDAIQAALDLWGEAAREPPRAPPPPPRRDPPPDVARRATPDRPPAAPAAPTMTYERAVAIVGRLGYFRVLDRNPNFSHKGHFSREDLLRAAREMDIPPLVAEAMRFLAQPDQFAKLDTAWGRWSGDARASQADNVVAQIDLVAAIANDLTWDRALSLAHVYFDVLDAADGKADGVLKWWVNGDLDTAWQRPDLPLEARAAALWLRKNFRRVDTAADDLAQTPWTEQRERWVDTGRDRGRIARKETYTVSGRGGRPDSIIGRRDIEALLPVELGPKLDPKVAIEVLRRPENWSRIVPPGQTLTREMLDAAWKREGWPPDLRIAAYALTDPKKFDAIANASGVGQAGRISRDDLHAHRGVMTTLRGRLDQLPAVDADPAERAAFDARVRALETRVNTYADTVLPRIAAAHDRMQAEIRAAREQHRDGIPDDVTAKIRADYRARIEEIVRLTGDQALVEELRRTLEAGVETHGRDVLKNPALVRAMGRMLDVDDARADFISLGAQISSRSEDLEERNASLHAHRVAVREELIVGYNQINDAYYAIRNAEMRAQRGIVSMPATGFVEIWRGITGGPGMVELQREQYANQDEARRLFEIALSVGSYGSTATDTGRKYDEYWSFYRGTVAPKLGDHATRTGDYINAIGTSRDILTSGVAMIPSLIPGVGIVWAVAVGGLIKGGAYVADEWTGGREISWSTAGYNVAVGGLENLSAGVGGIAGRGVSNLTRSLGPLASTSLTVVVRGGTTGGMIGGGRATLAGEPLDKVVEHTYKGAAFGILFDAVFTSAGAGLRRAINGPAVRPPPALEPPRVPGGNSGDTIVIAAPESGTALFERIFRPNPAVKVTVTRSNGAVENDWAILSTDARGRIIVGKREGGQAVTKAIEPARLLEANPHLLRGATVHVPRTNAPMDDGWVVDSVLPNGRLKVVGPGGVHKEMPVADVIRFNADRLLPAAAPRDITLPAQAPGRQQSEAFLTGHRVEPGAPIADGYVDGGRGMRIAADGRLTTGRELIVVDRTRDLALQKHLEYARSLRGLPEAERTRLLAEYVDRLMTPAAGRHASEAAVNGWQGAYTNKEVLLGDVAKLGGGVCRHRSLLFKVLGDEAGLQVALVRGNMGFQGPGGPQLGGHAWNEVRLGNGDTVIVDVMNPTVGQGGRFTFPKTGQVGDAYRNMGGQPLYQPTPPPAQPNPSSQTQVIKLPPTPEQVAAARRWADELAASAPRADPAQVADEAAALSRRQNEVRANYEAVMRGEMEPPPGVTRERLRLAVEGDPLTGQRVPLNFQSVEQFQRFQRELREVFESEGITDVVVQQLGSATTGWKGNPNKPIGPWKPSSDSDFAIFSDQVLAQARAANAPVNTKIVQGGKYTILKNTGGFGETPLGRKLDALSKKWNKEVYGDPHVDGFDFKVNLDSRPTAIDPIVFSSRGGGPKK